ncbi:hypothetical protein BLA29_013105, partial [Euroglyphus maynei]
MAIGDDDNEVKTRRSLRASSTTTTSNRESVASTMKQEPLSSSTPSEKRGKKRKSLTSNETPSSSKLPKYEFIPINLEAKSIVLPDDPKYIFDRQRLISVPPKEGCISVGDLIWAKMQGYPWWPCMITVDPCTGSHNRVSRSYFFAIK